MYVLTFGRRFYFLSKILQLYPLSIPKQRQKKEKREKKRKKGNAIVFSMDLVGRPASPPKNLVARPKIFEREAKRQNGNNKSMPNGIRVIWNFVRQPKKKTICKWIAGEKRGGAKCAIDGARSTPIESRIFFWGYLLIPSRVFNSVSLSLQYRFEMTGRRSCIYLLAILVGLIVLQTGHSGKLLLSFQSYQFQMEQGPKFPFFFLTIKMRTETTVQVQRNGNSR